MRVLHLKIVRIGLTILLLAGCGELAVRLRARSLHGSAGLTDDTLYISDSLMGRVLRPGARIDGHESQLSVNSLGFRGEESPLAKPAGELRVVCMGDSLVFSRFAPSDRLVWTAQLQEQLTRRLGRPVRVVNAGVPGYTMATMPKLPEHRVASLKPDVILVLQVVNDINAASAVALGQASQASAAPAEPAVARQLQRLRDENLLSYHLIRKNLTPLLTPLAAGQQRHDTVSADFARSYEERLIALIHLARRHNTPVIVCTSWRAFRGDQDDQTQQANAAALLLINPYLSVQGFHAAFRRFNDAVRTVARREGAAVIDMASLFPADKRLFRDSVHLSESGHDLAARIFAEQLTPLLAEKIARGVQ